MIKKDAYKSNELQLQNHSSTFFNKNKSFLSATSILSRSPMADNTTSLRKLTCNDYVDFGKCQDRFGRFSWSENDSNYMDVKLKVFKERRVPTGTKSYNGGGRLQLGNIFPNKETSRDHDHRRSVYKRQLAATKSFVNFPPQKNFTSFSYQRSISTTKPRLTKLLLPSTNSPVPIMWNLENLNTDCRFS